MRSRRRFLTITLCLPAGVGAMAGCASPPRVAAQWRGETPSPVAVEALSDEAFLHHLAGVPVVSVDEGMRAVLLLAPAPTNAGSREPGEAHGTGTFETRHARLVEMGAVREAWRLRPDEALDLGTLAYMLAAVCEVRPSLNERLAAITGLGDRRYALRTCVARGLLPYGRTGRPVVGGELIMALTQAERRKDGP